jgi:hypothetical protein
LHERVHPRTFADLINLDEERGSKIQGSVTLCLQSLTLTDDVQQAVRATT